MSQSWTLPTPTLGPWTASSPKLLGSPAPATPCYSLPSGPPSTCSPTTRPAGTPSSRPSSGSPGTRGSDGRCTGARRGQWACGAARAGCRCRRPARPPPHLLLLGARLLGDAAHARPDHGAVGVQRPATPGDRLGVHALPEAGHVDGDRIAWHVARVPVACQD